MQGGFTMPQMLAPGKAVLRAPAATRVQLVMRVRVPDLMTGQVAQAALEVTQVRVTRGLAAIREFRVTQGRLETPALGLLQEAQRLPLGRDKLALLAAREIRDPVGTPARGLQTETPVTPVRAETPDRLAIPALLGTQVLLDLLCLPRHIQA